ncbi:MAG: 1-deoxy-D-xylulose-5-phosphate reductoisomerase, partial [Planctomycetota bacterium]
LGATGSIGTSTLAVLEHLSRTGHCPHQVVGLAAHHHARALAREAKRFGATHLALAHPPAAAELPQPSGGGYRLYTGPDAARQLIEDTQPDVVVAAVVGVAGLTATIQALTQGCVVALANKETLVAAGSLVMPLVEKHGGTLLPIDSEHSALFQCLGPHAARPNPPAVRRVVLTASGGPFRDAPLETLRNATPEQALNHPTWDMGPKITIDSATMMNKALEVIEAHHLFQLPPEKIDVLIHPQSVVHGLVEFADHSVTAQLGPPDMRTPIQVALTHPQRLPGCSDQLDWTRLARLDFRPPDAERFPALRLAYRVIRAGLDGAGNAGAVLNAANEAAVAAFLERRIRFGRIVELVAAALDHIEPRPLGTLDDALLADRLAREFVRDQITTDPVPAA